MFANLARRTNSRIQVSRENYFYNSANEEKEKHANLVIHFVKNLKIRNS